MMNWSEAAMIWFSCVAANHLGLIAAAEKTVGRSLPIINCPKCFTWWALMGYGLSAHESFFVTIAASFLFSYLATWLELIMGFIDTLYIRLYEKIIQTDADIETATDADGGNAEGSVP